MKNRILDKLEKGKHLIVPENLKRTKNLVTSISFSLLLVLNPIATKDTKADADLISPTPKNLIISPVYSCLEINLWHGVLYNDNENTVKKLQNGWKKYLEENLSKKYPNLNFDSLSKDLIQYFIEIYRSKSVVDFFIFVNSYIKICNKFGISKEDSLDLLLTFISNRILPDDILRKIDIDPVLEIAIDDLRGYYGEKEFKNKISQVYLLYQRGQLNKEKINDIFSDYLKYRSDYLKYMNIEGKVLLVIIFFSLLICGVASKVLIDSLRDTF